MVSRDLKETVVLVTAGPTRAYIDKVRYLSNYSSGQLGYEICRELEKHVGQLIAVVGPCDAPFHRLKSTQVIKVQTVHEMRCEVMSICKKKKPEFAILSAAVLDFEPKKIEPGKVSSKKSWKIHLVPTPKIIDEISVRFPHIKKVAFKLEWKAPSLKQIRQFAGKNLIEKSSEALCLNYLSEIEGKYHPAFFFTPDGKFKKLYSKIDIAKEICRFIRTSEAVPKKK